MLVFHQFSLLITSDCSGILTEKGSRYVSLLPTADLFQEHPPTMRFLLHGCKIWGSLSTTEGFNSTVNSHQATKHNVPEMSIFSSPLKPSGYFMYHQVYNTKIPHSTHSVVMLSVWISK